VTEDSLKSDEAQKRLTKIREAMEKALRTAGRKPGEATLLAVSKTFPFESVKTYLTLGQFDFGESYIQEAKDKIPLLPKEARWHFIGRLQANKTRFAAQLFSFFHALDSIDLAAELHKRLLLLNRTLKVYVQVNVSGEESKSGISPIELKEFLDQLSSYPSLEPVGLMTMPPYELDPEKSRPHFRKLYELREKIAPSLKGLSMGMSGDFEAAIEEGATIIRVGTALFGSRDYT